MCYALCNVLRTLRSASHCVHVSFYERSVGVLIYCILRSSVSRETRCATGGTGGTLGPLLSLAYTEAYVKSIIPHNKRRGQNRCYV